MLNFLIAAILLTLIPGPDILLVITQSVIRGAKTGIIFAAGLCTGIIFHTLVVAFGLSSLITSNATVFTTIKLLGALYLIYIGIMSYLGRNKATLNAPQTTIQSTSTHKKELLQHYKRGVIMNILNPKVILFFLALFPQFITIQEGQSTTLQFLVMGIIFIAQAFIIFSTVAFCAGKLSKYIIGNKKFAYYLSLIEAGVFILLALLILKEAIL